MAESPLFRELTGRVKTAWRDNAEQRQRIRKWREIVNPKDKDKRPANLILSNINTLMPFVYAKNPDISVRPALAVEDDAYEAHKNVSEFLEIAIPRLFREARLKRKARRSIRSAMVTGSGWLKVGWQGVMSDMPAFASTLPDSQDNLLRLEKDADELAKGGEPDEKEEIQERIEGIASDTELKFAHGLVLDYVRPEDMVVDPSVSPLYLEDAAWVAQRIWLRRDLVEARYKVELKNPTIYAVPFTKDEDERDEHVDEKTERDEWVVVWELWERTYQRVFTWVEGEEKWLREPYSPRAGFRWYPYFPIALIEDDDGNPVSLVDLLDELQREYDERRKAARKHREKAMPKAILDSSLIDRADAKRLEEAAPFATVPMDLGGRPADALLRTIEFPKIDFRLYDTTDIRQEMDMLSGVQDAMRGAVVKAKTATEASILQQGMSGRVGEMRDAIEDWLQDIAEYSASLILQNMDDVQASKLAGRRVMLPKANVEEAIQLYSVEIKSGTTGKPDEAGERERWMQLLPVMQQMYQAAMQVQAQGGDPTPAINLMKETLRRFDERIDVDEFFPNEGGMNVGSTGTGADGAAGIPGIGGAVGGGTSGIVGVAG